MIVSSPSEHVAAVPTGLLTAAIDFINVCKPAPQLVQIAVMALARRLAYDQITAVALAARVSATARMFADPHWPSVRQLGCAGEVADRARFEAVVQQFIASAPLDTQLSFDVRTLQLMLLAALPQHGNC